MQEMKVEVLLSAMHQKDFFIGYNTKIDSDLLIINQCDEEKYEEMEVNGHTWRMISTTARGLSKSRNLALDNAKGDICLFCDDDEELAKGYADIVARAYEKVPKASAIVFNINRINYKMKKTYYRIRKIRKAPSYRGYGSIMMSFRLKDVRAHGLRLNENFGSGTPWGGGEDILFQDDFRRCRLKIYEYPEEIGTVDYGNGSNWFNGYTEKYFYNLGAFVQHKFKRNIVLKYLRCLFTCYRLRREKTLSVAKKMKWMKLGIKGH